MENDRTAFCNATVLTANSSTLRELQPCFNSSVVNGTSLYGSAAAVFSSIDTGIVFVCFVYGVICLAGTVGNGLVVYVVVRYAKMRSVPNVYLLNLAVSDICFLLLLPFLIVTALRKMWIFGEAFCKLFYILTSLNWFASVFTLIVMSADRYMAVCHPVSSIRYRTPGISLFVCLCVWVVSTLFMLPICLYAEAVEESGVKSCTIQWPKTELISPERAFTWYSMLIGFAVPMVLISAFYVLVVLRLKTCGPKRKAGQPPRRTPHSHRRVTRMVLAIVTVHVVCWLPYWAFQVALTFNDADYEAPAWQILVFQFVTIFSYTNSVFNPLLYAFLGDNFRQTFAKSITCQGYDVRLSTRASDVSARSNRTTRSSQNTDSDRKRELAKAKTDPDNRHQIPAAEIHALLALPGESDGGLTTEETELNKYGRRRHHNHHHQRHVSSLSAISLVEDLNRNHGNSAPDARSFEPAEGAAAPIEAGFRETEF